MTNNERLEHMHLMEALKWCKTKEGKEQIKRSIADKVQRRLETSTRRAIAKNLKRPPTLKIYTGENAPWMEEKFMGGLENIDL